MSHRLNKLKQCNIRTNLGQIVDQLTKANSTFQVNHKRCIHLQQRLLEIVNMLLILTTRHRLCKAQFQTNRRSQDKELQVLLGRTNRERVGRVEI